MPRTKISARRQEQRQKAEREEKVRLAQIRMDSALEQIDELAKRYKQEVDNQIKLIRGRTDKQLLQMKWSDFATLKIKTFAEHQWAVPKPPTTRSLSICRARTRTPQNSQFSQFSRLQTQSADRALRGDTMSFVRWPRAGEQVLSKAGSPLAVQTQPDRCADVHIPTKNGVITVKPHKINSVKREVLMQLDENTLNQVKTLNANLGLIVDMATKMAKLKP
ncbi:borealin isoform X1 [Drosophila subpulchrella]|uniref:borealin isoform X1 n=1 Tax=Drosophila subpulchrella TaxID=1486046 RepID=UPI0018A12CB2|nr:borealin isoform X1 [Drosophila subpulchrella]XP_037711631.1 borealin isoform X1 [Drosophila subpulchrella]